MKRTPTLAVLSLALASAGGVGEAAADGAIHYQSLTRESLDCRQDDGGCSHFQGYVVVNPSRRPIAPPLEGATRSHADYSAATASGETDPRLRRLYLGPDSP